MTTPTASAQVRLSARQRLMALAASVEATPADASTDLPYTYLHTQSWARATNVIARIDLQRWRRDTDDSGREVTRRLPDVPGLAYRPTSRERDQFTAARATDTPYLRGDLRPYLADPFPTEPTALAGMLAPRQMAGEPAYPRMLVHGIIGLATNQYLNQTQRAATLRVLADVPNITYQGEQADLAGRIGISLTVIAGGSTTQLVVHPHTGEILAAHEQVSGAKPGLFSYVLILERGHTANDTATPPTRP
ncbi:hypothetical protein [Micromonospora sp. NPDC049107]|uniref:hypothetical protein n=1 Tax=unclassified Micromonospora TaxID=2617518 RepID=UPI0033F4C223